tara:strand:- start:1299 stop:1451 length:153 start_codon:yes stop_codon:yes gene_type:complete
LDDWNKKFDSEALKKISKIKEMERNKNVISSSFESKKDLYVLNNTILQII